MKLDVPYHNVPLLSAFYGRDILSPHDLAFAQHAPIGERLSVALGVSLESRSRNNVAELRLHRLRVSNLSPAHLKTPFTLANNTAYAAKRAASQSTAGTWP